MKLIPDMDNDMEIWDKMYAVLSKEHKMWAKWHYIILVNFKDPVS